MITMTCPKREKPEFRSRRTNSIKLPLRATTFNKRSARHWVPNSMMNKLEFLIEVRKAQLITRISQLKWLSALKSLINLETMEKTIYSIILRRKRFLTDLRLQQPGMNKRLLQQHRIWLITFNLLTSLRNSVKIHPW